MTQPLPPRARISRQFAAFAAIGLVGVMSAIGTPASAEPVESYGSCPTGFGATAASDILALRALDAQPLGASFDPVAGIHLAPSESGMAGSPARAAAQADTVTGDVLGLELPGVEAYQQAPPPHADGVTRSVAAANLGLLSFGVGTVSAHAGWRDAAHCTEDAGLRSTSNSTTGQVSVLPGVGGRALLRAVALKSGTSTGITSVDGVPAATATATGDVARFELFSGTNEAVTVAIVSQPRLTVTAGRSQSVDYSAPVLRITAPGVAPTRLSSAGSHVELAITNPVVNTGAHLLRPGGSHSGSSADQVQSLIGELPVPSLNGISDLNSPPNGFGHGDPRWHRGYGQSVVLQLSLGDLDKQSNSTGVHAQAASIRVKLLLRDHNSDTTLLDTGLCVLDAAAAAPKGWTVSGSGSGYGSGNGGGGYGSGSSGSGNGSGPGNGGGSGPGNGGGSGYGGGGAGSGGASPTPSPSATPTTPPTSLPVTGSRVTLIAAAGVILLIAGRMFLVLARRRRAL